MQNKIMIHKAAAGCVNGFWNLLYPHRCPVCHDILMDQKSLICPECLLQLRPLKEPFCKKCGVPVSAEDEFCSDCRTGERSFSQGRGIFIYDKQMRSSVLMFKYGGRREYGRFFSAAMCYYGREFVSFCRPDLVVPIPLHRSKKKRRGFNQAAVLSEGFQKYLGLPVSEEALVKVHKTGSQKKLDKKSRRDNLKDAFRADPMVKGKRIILIDDVFTTGSTVEAASESLKKAGAEEVFFMTLCMGVPAQP